MSEEHREEERHYSTGETEYRESEPMKRSFEREDERWSTANQLRDWLILIIFLALHFTWMFIVFLFEPGIR